MLLSLSLTGLLLSLILLVFNARKSTFSIYLGSFFILVSLYGFIQYTVLYSHSVLLIAIVFLNVGFPVYLAGPFLYWYVRSLLTDRERLTRKDLWHLIPMFLYLAATIPYILTSWSYKLQVAASLSENMDNLARVTGIILFDLLPKWMIYLSRPLLVMGYTLWSALMFFRFLKEKKEGAVLSGQRFMVRWLAIFLSFLTLLLVTHMIQLISAFQTQNVLLFSTLNILQILSGAGLAGLLISPFFFPGVLYGLPRIPDPPVSDLTVASDAIPVMVKKSNIRLEDEYLKFIDQKLTRHLSESQPYLNSDFQLSHLSVAIQVPVHHLSYYLREFKGYSFTDLRNRLRIEYAKELIRKGMTREVTIEAIGAMSGFASRNTFMNAFKKIEGISPGEFAAEIKNG